MLQLENARMKIISIIYLVTKSGKSEVLNTLKSRPVLKLYFRPEDPETLEYLMCISDKMKAAILETHGKEYTTGQSRDVVGYAAGGTTEDYSYDDLQIPLTWVVELRDTGDYGFLLPSNQIIPTAEELTNAFIQMFKEIKTNSC